MLGDDFFEWPGALITVSKVPQRNPKTGEQTWGLVVSDARKYRGSQAKIASVKAPKKIKKSAAAHSTAPKYSASDDDIPI
jgi:hypothetical protein